MAAQPDIVRDMRISHQEIVVADGSDHSPAFGAAMQRREFADAIAMPDAQLAPLALVFEILRRDADSRIRKEDVVLPDGQRPFHENVTLDHGARSDFDIRSDD